MNKSNNIIHYTIKHYLITFSKIPIHVFIKLQ